MRREKEFLKNSIILILGKLSTQFISFLMLPIYTIYLTTKDYGNADLVISYSMLLVPLLTLQIENATFRFLVDQRNNFDNSSKIIKNTFSFYNIVAILISLLVFIISTIVKSVDLILLLIFSISYLYSSLMLQIARGFGKNKYYSISCCISGIVMILSNIILIIIFKMGFRGMIISYSISYFTSFSYLFYVLNLKEYIFNKKTKEKEYKKMLSYSIPLIPNALSWWILNASDRTIIKIVIGSAANGIYAVSNKFSSLYVGLFNMVNLSWIESVSLNIEANDNYIEKMTNKILRYFTELSAFFILLISIFFKYVIAINYHDSYYQIPILIVGALFTVGLATLQSIYIGLKKTKDVAKTTIICAIINIVLNILFINKIGLYAASISTLVSNLCLFIYRIIDLKKYVKIKLSFNELLYPFVLLIICCTSYYISSILLSTILFIIILIVTILVELENIKIIVNYAKSMVKKNNINKNC